MLLSELGWREWNMPVQFQGEAEIFQVNPLQRDGIAGSHLLAEAHPFPTRVCRSVCSHHQHHPRSCPRDWASRDRRLSWKTRVCSSQHLALPEEGFAPPLSETADKHLIFSCTLLRSQALHQGLYTSSLISTDHRQQSSIFRYCAPSSEQFIHFLACVCLFPFLVLFLLLFVCLIVFPTVPGVRLFCKLIPLRNASLIIRLLYIDYYLAHNTFISL